MTKETFIALVRLTKKLFNDQQDALSNNQSYLGMLNTLSAVAEKVDNQLRLIPLNQEAHFTWLPNFVFYARQWRESQRDYVSTQYESLLAKCKVNDDIMQRGFTHIKKNDPDVLTNPNTQTAMF